MTRRLLFCEGILSSWVCVVNRQMRTKEISRSGWLAAGRTSYVITMSRLIPASLVPLCKLPREGLQFRSRIRKEQGGREEGSKEGAQHSTDSTEQENALFPHLLASSSWVPRVSMRTTRGHCKGGAEPQNAPPIMIKSNMSL